MELPDLTEDQIKSYTDRIAPLLERLGMDASLGPRLDNHADLISLSEAKVQELQCAVDAAWGKIISLRAAARNATHSYGFNDSWSWNGSWSWNTWRQRIDYSQELLEGVHQEHNDASLKLKRGLQTKQALGRILHERSDADLDIRWMHVHAEMTKSEKSEYEWGAEQRQEEFKAEGAARALRREYFTTKEDRKRMRDSGEDPEETSSYLDRVRKLP